MAMLAATPPGDQARNDERLALGRLAHKQRSAWLRSLYHDDHVRQRAHAEFAAAAAAASGKPEFGWLGYEALVAKYGEDEAQELLARARQKRQEKYGKEGIKLLARKGHSTAASKEVPAHADMPVCAWASCSLHAQSYRPRRY